MVEQTRSAQGQEETTLIHDASRAGLWNVLLLPLVAILNLAFSVVLRRQFGLFSGVYDIVLGLLAALLLYSNIGIPTSLTKFLPELESTGGAHAVIRFFRRVVVLRLALLAVALVPLNLFSESIAARLDLGQDGTMYLRVVSWMVVARAVIELAIKALNAFFAQVWSNLLALGQATLDVGLVGFVLLLGYRMDGVFGALLASSLLVALAASVCVWRILGRLPRGSHSDARDARDAWELTLADEEVRFFRFTSFTYVFELSLYFAGMAFAGPVLAMVLDREQVALFATAFKMAFMTVGLVVVGFRGLYRPIFARLRSRGDVGQLRRAFIVLSKVQVLLLVPAGVGLAIMLGDYIPLLFGVEFASAVPVARILVAALYVETAFNLGNIVLSIDERYRAVLGAQSLLVIAAPVFVVAAAYGGLAWAAVVFGGARVATACVGYALSRRRYDFRFPWTFLGKVGGIALAMAIVLLSARAFLETSPLEAVALTVLGAAVFGLGLRVVRVLGEEEVRLLQRSQVPGHRWLLSWCARAD